MITTRPKQDREKTVLSWARVAVRETARALGVTEWDLNTLLIIDAIQAESNSLVSIKQIKERLGNGMVNAVLLVNAGYLDRVAMRAENTGANQYLYNVTIKGEYIVRAFFIRLSRLVNDSKLSKARLTRERKKKLSGYLRPATRKGVKLY